MATTVRVGEVPAVTTWERRGLLAGVLFGVAQLAAVAFSMLVVVPTHAPVGAPPEETAAALAAHTTLIAIGTYLFVVPMPFFLVFVGGLFAVLRRAERGETLGASSSATPSGGVTLSAAALAAGAAAAVAGPAGAVLSGLAGETARLGGDAAVVKQLDAITPLMMALTGLPQSVLVGAVLVVLGGRGLLPRWLWWWGAIVALLALAGSATIALHALFPLVVFGMVLFPAWSLALSVVLLRRFGQRVE